MTTPAILSVKDALDPPTITPEFMHAMHEQYGDVLNWPLQLQLSHTGDAARFAEKYGAIVRYTVGRGWLVWDGKRFTEDVNNATVTGYMQQVARSLYDYGMTFTGVEDEKTRNSILNHASKLPNRDALAKSLELATKIPTILVHDDAFDSDPLILNCQNGIVDLVTGRLTPHDPAQMCSKIAGVDYVPDAPAERWQRFKREIFNNDESLVRFDRQWNGYCLTGLTREHQYVIAYGEGANGKTTEFNAIRYVMGDYCRDINVAALAAKHEPSNLNTDLARLPGARLTICPEWDEDMRADESTLKSLTGDDYLTIRTLYKLPFSFKPQTKIVIYGNHKPQLRGSDAGTWRRPLLMPYIVSFRGREDKDLPNALLAESEGILADMVRGCMDWLQNGLVIPQRIIDETAQYRQDSNDLIEFISAMCIKNENARSTVGTLHAAYLKWGGGIKTAKMFGSRLREAGYQTDRTRNGYQVIGLGLEIDDR